MSNASIIGSDPKMCPCCGGPEIVIDNIANPGGRTYFLIGQLPASFNTGINPILPIAVKIDYTINSSHCYGNYVDITRIERR